MKLGKKLGSGMTAEVYEIGNDNVLKLFLENIPTDWVEYEFKIAHEAGKLFDLAVLKHLSKPDHRPAVFSAFNDTGYPCC